MAATSSGGSASAAAGYSSAGVLSSLFVSLRPAQWVKNLVLPLPFLFGGALARSSGWALAAEGFAVFCVLSSGVYLINDVKDRERDRAHPVKRNRPLATGLLGVKTAVAAGIALLAGGLLAAFLLDGAFGQLSALYAGLMVLYSLGLKQVPFLEALIVAAGLPLRALAGAALAHVPASPFLMGCAYTLALFLVVGKRQWELQNAGTKSSAEHRSVLAVYHAEWLDFVFVTSALTVVASYAVYSVIPSTLQRHGGRSFAATVPFVILGVARYVRLVYRRGGGGNPTRALLIDDPWLLLIVVGWVLTAGGIIYAR
ncbi:MAG TPA: UbiA prenyltransferase family protein [Thermoanaerobaculia bacterium]|nr:UbiA prenyltransferase family protein [Thermoanaerobaculia bacterium]